MSPRSDWRYGACGPPMSGPSSQSSPSQPKRSNSPSYDSWVLRATSVSSMRRTSFPPVCRAKSQLNRNVRTSPTCGLPVGDGGKRTRMGRSVTGGDPIREAADAGNRDLDLVTDLHRADAVGGAGEDHVARQEGHHAGDVGDQGGDVEDQVLGRPILLQVTVE